MGAIPHLRRAAADPKVTDNPLFTASTSRESGTIWRPGCPWQVDGAYRAAVPAPELGDHTVAVLRDRLGLTVEEISRLTEAGTVA